MKLGSYNEYISRREYYENLIHPKSFEFFEEIQNTKNLTILTSSIVKFKELKFGISPEEVVLMIGEPRYIIKEHELPSLIYFYKESINNNRVITQIHFLNGEFFYACYTFRYRTRNDTSLIKHALFNDFLEGSTKISEYNQIVDGENSSISIIDNVHINISYLWGNKKIFMAANDVVNLEDTNAKKYKQESFLKLFMRLWL